MEMACEGHVGGSSGIGKREPTAKIADFSIDPDGFWLRATDQRWIERGYGGIMCTHRLTAEVDRHGFDIEKILGK